MLGVAHDADASTVNGLVTAPLPPSKRAKPGLVDAPGSDNFFAFKPLPNPSPAPDQQKDIPIDMKDIPIDILGADNLCGGQGPCICPFDPSTGDSYAPVLPLTANCCPGPVVDECRDGTQDECCLMPAPPRVPPSPSPAPPSAPPYVCENTCRNRFGGGSPEYANNKHCQDGHPDAKGAMCMLGTDCDDCGLRYTSPPSPPTPPPPTPPPPTPPPPTPPPSPTPPMLCSDECLAHLFGDGGPYGSNSYCQDGAAGDDRVTGNTCAYGTDCTDCSPRYYMPPSHPPPPPSPSHHHLVVLTR